MEQVDVVYNLIRTIERVYRCRVCIVDGAGNFLFSRNFPDVDTTHLAPACNTFRHQHRSVCRSFDEHSVTQHYFNVKNVFFKICHAGFMEAVTTVVIPGYKMFHVYAGIFKPFAEKDMPPDSLIVKKRLQFAQPDELTVLTPEEFRELPTMMTLLGQELTSLFQKQLYESTQYPLAPQAVIRDFINSQFRRNISLADLARHLGWTPSHTTVRVRGYFGKTFTELLNIRRVENAKWLLSNEYPVPMAGIGKVSGFSTPSYFFRVFRKITGMTPVEYRKMLVENNKLGQMSPPENIG
ncbi:MAG: helix-turn-helix transcriptional regulator [Lentisphaeria bacterium]|nr:helix-turn-helix transcriptional regulator [Lentisphaeria bacterium]